MASKLGSLAGILGAGLVIASNAIYLVNPGERALIMNQATGLKQQVYDQGYRFKLPFIEVPLVAPRNPSSTTPASSPDIHVSTGTKDLQTVSISLRILQQPIA